MENSLTILHHISSSFLFCGLTSHQLQKIAYKTHIQTFRAGHILIEEDRNNDKIFLILEGLVKIYKLTDDGKEVFLAVEKSGDYLGVMDLSTTPATATIETLLPTKVLVLQKKDLAILLEENAMLWERMYRIILAKVEEYRQLQTITLSYDLRQRTYLFLGFLAKFFHNNVIPLSHEQVATIVGATRPRVTEVLQYLQKQRKITMSPKKITLL